ncbi:MAG: ATP-binding protein [Paludibacteraceae bacterium]|nr:ATP-binding protein [Paludibacteraceae bacterium]
MIQRSYFQTIKNRLNEPRSFIQVLYGPRQVGKTTLIKQVLDEISAPFLFATADDIIGADGVWLRTTWNEARLKIKTAKYTDFVLVIDEIQKIENWSEIVKKEWDSDTFNDIPIKLVILGSSSLLIQKGLTESLAGRFEAIAITHWSFTEMNEAFDFDIDDYIWFGGYPGSAKLIKDEERWKQYIRTSLIETSISRDILMLSQIEKPALLRRLFNIGCSYSAQILSLTKVQGELMEKGNITTLSNYLSLLKSAGLLCGLEKFSGDIIRTRSSKPKFQVFNNALISSQSELTKDMAKNDHKLWGRLVESAIGMHLLNKTYTENFNLYYWNENSNEVDFVIEKGDKIIGIEVKSGKDSTNNGMAIFESKFHPTALYTVGTNGIPIEDFLRSNPSNLF